MAIARRKRFDIIEIIAWLSVFILARISSPTVDNCPRRVVITYLSYHCDLYFVNGISEFMNMITNGQE